MTVKGIMDAARKAGWCRGLKLWEVTLHHPDGRQEPFILDLPNHWRVPRDVWDLLSEDDRQRFPHEQWPSGNWFHIYPHGPK